MRFLISLLFCTFSVLATAGDLGFRYVDGRCVNQSGQTGHNKSYFGQCTDFSRLVAGRFDFSSMDLSGSLFTGSNLQEVSFAKATCIGCDFSAASLKGMDFTGAVLKDCNFKNAVIANSRLAEAKIVQSDFSLANFDGLNLSYFSPEKSQFVGAHFHAAVLDSADLSGNDLEEADFSDSNLTSATLNQVQATRADFSRANLTKATVRGSDFRSAIFQQAKLNQATLQKSDLRGANFHRASLVGSQLDNSDLAECNLQRSDLTQATYQGAGFQNALYSYTTLLPFSKVDAAEMQMVYVDRPLVFLIWDNLDREFLNFIASIEDSAEVVMSASDSSHFKGENLTMEMDVVLQFTRLREAANMEPMGQDSVASYVKAGGRYIYGPAIEKAFSQGNYKNMSDLILNKYRGINTSTIVTRNSTFAQNPLLAGLSPSFAVSSASYNGGPVRDEFLSTVQIFARNNSLDPIITKRQVGKGYSLAIKFDCSQYSNCLDNTNVVQLFKNAMTVAW